MLINNHFPGKKREIGNWTRSHEILKSAHSSVEFGGAV